MTSLRVVVAPDSFKGTFTSLEVARALARGWRRARPDDELLLAPLADGGEGTLVAIAAAGGWETRTTVVRDPLGRPVEARWLLAEGGGLAVVEMAEAVGLSRLRPDERDAVRASSYGLGELLLEAVRSGARELIVGIGGSATTDGGRGMLEALGMREGSDGSVELAGLDPTLAQVAVRVACDVTNPLLGERGAAAVYGPQKGASPEQVPFLDARLAAFADAVEAATGRRVRDEPGAGAAGGVGFALLALAERFRSFALEPGVALVMAATGFAERVTDADLVITGEGRIDGQTAFGKTVAGVAHVAADAGVRCVAVGGGVEPAGRDALEALAVEVVAVADRPLTLDEARAAGTAPLEAVGERLARDATLGDVPATADPSAR